MFDSIYEDMFYRMLEQCDDLINKAEYEISDEEYENIKKSFDKYKKAKKLDTCLRLKPMSK